MQSYGERVRQIRQMFDLSQSDLADLIGVHKQVISDVERGRQKRFSMEAEAKLIEKLHLNPQWLLKGEGQPIVSQESIQHRSDTKILSDEERILLKYFNEIPKERLFDAFLCLLECIKKFR